MFHILAHFGLMHISLRPLDAAAHVSPFSVLMALLTVHFCVQVLRCIWQQRPPCELFLPKCLVELSSSSLTLSEIWPSGHLWEAVNTPGNYHTNSQQTPISNGNKWEYPTCVFWFITQALVAYRTSQVYNTWLPSKSVCCHSSISGATGSPRLRTEGGTLGATPYQTWEER